MGRRDRRRNLAAAMGLVVLIGAGVGLTAIGPEALIPVPGLTVRLDLLGSRDLEVNGDLPAGGTSDNKPPVSAQTWTRTGGESCYPISSTDASCFAASEVPYTVDATGAGWVVEPDATNRILYSALAGGIDCVNWTCSGTGDATPGEVAPDGSATASVFLVGTSGNDVKYQASGYTASTAMHLRLWYKGSGDVWITNPLGSSDGLWTVSGSALSGAWELLDSSHAAVTVVNAWASTAGGASGVQFQIGSGTTSGSIWAPTLTEEPGTGLAVIPTGAAAVSTGDPVWAIANGLRNTGSQLLVDGDMEDATTIAYTAAGDAALTKETTSPQAGVRWMKVTSAAGGGRAVQVILTIGNIYRVVGYSASDGVIAPKFYDGGAVSLWTGTTSTSWQAFDVSFSATADNIWFYTSGAGWTGWDSITIYEQESYGDYYRTGDTVTQSITEISGTCWDPLTSTGDLLLSGLEGTQCAGIIYSLEVSK